jgi:hypothetical protein
MVVFDLIILGMVTALREWGGGLATVVCPDVVAKAIIKDYGEAVAHVVGGKEFKEGLLPTGAKLLRCQHRTKDGRWVWGYSLSTYAYDCADGINILQAVQQRRRWKD